MGGRVKSGDNFATIQKRISAIPDRKSDKDMTPTQLQNMINKSIREEME